MENSVVNQEKLKVKEGIDLSCCGIYSINCVLTGKVYVGSSINILSRYRDHARSLFLNNHKNHKLQSAYNDHAGSFYFDILEVCDVKHLRDRENFWINEKDSVDNGFNIARVSAHALCVSKERRRELNSKRKDSKNLVEFYNCMRELMTYKDLVISEGVLIGIYKLHIIPNNSKLSPSRLTKFGRMILRLMEEVLTLEDGNYKITHINYLKAEASYDLWEYTPENGRFGSDFKRVRTNKIYDRIVQLMMDEMSYCKLGKKYLESMEHSGINLC